MAGKQFKPALIIVDFQEDFCPPNGSLAVPAGRTIAHAVNTLLALPFPLKIATRDWHPRTHVSFASNHPSSEPFTSRATIRHPSDPSQSYTTTLWPVHCVQGTPGAQLVPELDLSQVHQVLDKGQDDRVEMYSAFYDPLHVSDSGLAKRLKEEHVTHVYVVGLAADFCVKATAEDAVAEGYETYIVEEATKPVMPDAWETCREGIVAKGVGMISIHGDDVARVKALWGK
ncbi:NAD(+) salvage pathway protein [Metarhizium acridum]|uniref:nicotinamidase n=1 Tax=Metarhizium acridum (strain CQMa 102) TaxID=655827 RepID=E9DYU4_METAQ|nr:uncharacterized protein MAC_02792 [Metarhizium acridum CQMa 102]EFY91121.1 hypothetical protein MAC_02792 [Metarhizium acridum CQMa 102]KAG8410857.1 NAD(+) salvage pathway protein [Metarhizium acridum]KAG8411652.1 NAD(+) salvage pathway protein [Metarhizium acridum]